MSSRIRLTTLVVAMALAVAAGAQTNPVENPVVVTVNGDPIRAAEVNLVAQQVAAAASQRGGQPDQQAVFDESVSQLIQTRLLAQEARRQKVTVPEGSVEKVMQQIEQQVGGREALETSLGQMGMSYAEMLSSVEETELTMAFVEQKIRPGITVTDEEAATFYKENPQYFTTPEQVHARHILIKTGDGVDEGDARARAEQAHALAVEGEDFAELAKKLSEGPSGPQGGDLGFFSANQMVPPFSEAAFALEPGQISDVVQTRFGYHVIKVEEKRSGGVQPLGEINDDLKRALTEQKMAAEIQTLTKSLEAQATIVPAAAPAQPGS